MKKAVLIFIVLFFSLPGCTVKKSLITPDQDLRNDELFLNLDQSITYRNRYTSPS
jgi:hypothetical protein